jgi:hypothetical protein
MSVVNGRATDSYLPGETPTVICFPTKSVHRAGDEVSDDG